ncbi:hypothetical protein BG004_000875 [Podila humilis]|nr:hypothetical protein BG004_000875 [Podila humilis]
MLSCRAFKAGRSGSAVALIRCPTNLFLNRSMKACTRPGYGNAHQHPSCSGFYHVGGTLSPSTMCLPRPLSAGMSLLSRFSKRWYSSQNFYQNRILDPYVQQAANPITIRQLVFFGRNMQEDKLLKSANYVRQELPVRLAHRIRDFQNLPFIVGTNPHIELVYDLYWHAFEKLAKVPEIKTLEENDRFCELVKGLLNDHLVVIPQLAMGIMECSKHLPPEQVDKFMSKMLRSRISRRVLAEQHISLTSNFNSPNHMVSDRGYIGIIYTHCNPRDIVERTAILAAETCRQSTGGKMEPPKVIMDGKIDAEFSYIPDHIEYILYELLKNSMRFVMQRGAQLKEKGGSGALAPIQVTVCEGATEIVFRVSDRGGGIDPEMESHLWSYSTSPAKFANFEKISKMTATVQEQMVSPSRSLNSAPPTTKAMHETFARGDTKDHHIADLEMMSQNQGSYVELPPPPRDAAMHQTRLGSPFGAGETTLLLDKHDPPRSSFRNATASHHEAPPSARSQPNGTCASEATTVIDPSQSKTPTQKKGHLDCESRHRAVAEVAKQNAKETNGHSSNRSSRHCEPLEDNAMHLGIGLPMSRVYAEYWGGELDVFTMHGYGTDAYAKFCKFGNIYENFDA